MNTSRRDHSVENDDGGTPLAPFLCEDVRAVLSGLLDDTLDLPRRHLADVHLTRCASCRNLLERAEDQDALVRQAFEMRTVSQSEVAARDFEDVIFARIGSGAAEPPDKSSISAQGNKSNNERSRLLMVSAWAGWMTAAAACIVLGLGLFGPGNDLNSPISNGGSSATGALAVSGASGAGSATVNPQVRIPDGAGVTQGSAIRESSQNSGPVQKQSPSPVVNAPVTGDSNQPGKLAVNSSQPSVPTQPVAIDSDIAAHQAAREAYSAGFLAGAGRQIVSAADRAISLTPSTDQGVETASDSQRPSTVAATETASAPGATGATAPNGTALNSGMKGTGPASEDATARITPDHIEAVHQASVLVDLIEQTGGEQAAADLHDINTALHYDDLLRRLNQTKPKLDPDAVDIVNQAMTVLEWTNGPLDRDELRTIRDSINQNDLSKKLEQLSDRYWSGM